MSRPHHASVAVVVSTRHLCARHHGSSLAPGAFPRPRARRDGTGTGPGGRRYVGRHVERSPSIPSATSPMPSLQSLTLLALRASLGLLMVVWGADKLANPAHGLRVSERFYFGLFGAAALMPVLGGLQIALGVAIVAGLLRRFTYPALLAITGLTLVGVWRSVLDPWGWVLEGTNALFFPSLIVFAGALVVHAFREADVLAVDARLTRAARGRQAIA